MGLEKNIEGRRELTGTEKRLSNGESCESEFGFLWVVSRVIWCGTVHGKDKEERLRVGSHLLLF